MGSDHRRRMELEDKAKVVASVQFLAALAVLPLSIWKKRFILFFQIDWGKTASAARNWTNFAPQTETATFALSSYSILLLWQRSIKVYRAQAVKIMFTLDVTLFYFLFFVGELLKKLKRYLTVSAESTSVVKIIMKLQKIQKIRPNLMKI